MKRILNFLLILSALLVTVSASYADTIINGAGATFPYPLYSRWAYDYQKKTGVKLNYQSIGSGGGVRQIIEKTVDFGASDDALKPEDVEKNKLLQWPQIIGGIVVVVNLSGIASEQIVLNANTISGIFSGEIKKWNDPSLKKLNSTLNLPDKEITVVHRSDGSGTTAVFTHYLAEASSLWKSKVGEGKSVKWPTGIGGKGNEGVANYVKRTANSIGYVEFVYAKQNKLTYTLLKNSSGKVVKPTLESFAEAGKHGDYNPKKHFYTWVTNVKAPEAWPIAAATNILISRDKIESNKKVVSFFGWAFSTEADAMAKELIYAPLPDALKKKVKQYWKEHGLL